MINAPCGVVFDMDGTLLDTETLARQYFVQACEDHGWSPDLSVYDQCIGTTSQATEHILRHEMGTDFPYEPVVARWMGLYGQHVNSTPIAVKPGMQALLQRLHDLQIPMAVATSTQRPLAERKLELAELSRYFDALVCGDETLRGKPYPDPYEKAVAQLRLSPGECWAVEDSDNGVRAAHAAGLVVMHIPDLLAPSEDVRALGHNIFDSALELLATLL